MDVLQWFGSSAEKESNQTKMAAIITGLSARLSVRCALRPPTTSMASCTNMVLSSVRVPLMAKVASSSALSSNRSLRLWSSAAHGGPSHSEIRSPPTQAPTLHGSNSVVITAAGPDRVGILQQLTSILADGNIEESRMTMLGNDFALILLVTLPVGSTADSVREKVQKAFPEFIVNARQTNTVPVLKEPTRILRIDLEGPDQPGIMQGLTKVFASNGVSIRDLDTDTSSAPFAGYRIFSLKSWVAVPKTTDLKAFGNQLRQFETENSVDLTIEDPSAVTEDSEGEEEEANRNEQQKKKK